MSALGLIEQARAFGAELVPMGSTLRIRTRRPLPDDLVAALRMHKAEVLAALSTSETVTVRQPDVASLWRPPDGREVWTSPPETMEQMHARYPGAVPWTDADIVTVTELLPEDEATIRAWLVSLGETAAAIDRNIETARRFPGTAVWLLARAHIDVTARATPHACGDCRRFTTCPEGDGGIGTCGITKARHPPHEAIGYPVCYPRAPRRCSDFERKEPLQ